MNMVKKYTFRDTRSGVFFSVRKLEIDFINACNIDTSNSCDVNVQREYKDYYNDFTDKYQ